MTLEVREPQATLAKKICREFEVFQDQPAVGIGGSCAKGFADRFSDLEVGVFWPNVPSNDALNGYLEKLDATITRKLYFEEPSFRAVHNVVIDSFPVDVVHQTTENFDRYLNKVVTEEIVEEHQQTIMSLATSFIPLLGKDTFLRWKGVASKYTETYRQKSLEAALKFSVDGYMLLAAQRNDIIIFQQKTINCLKGIVKTLYAINKRYFPGSKHMVANLTSLPNKPEDLVSKMEQITRSSPFESWKLTRALILETLDILALEMPDYDVQELRERLDMNRRQVPNHPVL